jgi:hypothetical protein
MACVPFSSCRMPSCGSSSISTSAISELTEGSQPGNSMPAALRMTLRPPSHPTRNCARRRRPSESSTSTPGLVLCEAGHLAVPDDRHLELSDPCGQDALEVVLPQRQAVVVPRWEVADVEADAGEGADLHRLSLGQEAIRDPALVEHLDRAGVHAAGARPEKLLGSAPFDDDDVSAAHHQLAGQHQSRRAASGDHHSVLRHPHPPAVCARTRSVVVRRVTRVFATARADQGAPTRAFRGRRRVTFPNWRTPAPPRRSTSFSCPRRVINDLRPA